MAERSGEKLYSPRLLALSAALADFPLDDTFDANSDARSRTCGSTISLGLKTDGSGRFARVGMRVSACAVGQSSAALLAQGIAGKSPDDLAAAFGQIEAWLAGTGALPDWPGFEALAPALPHAGRHEAILLPWRAALLALSSGLASR